MKLIEALNKICEQALELCEMALPSNEVHEYVRNLGYLIIEHLTKIILYPNNKDTVKHWEVEIENWLVQTTYHKIKTTKKFPTEKQLFNWIMEARCDEEELQATIRKIERKYGPVKDVNAKLMYNRVKSVISILVKHVVSNTLNINVIDKVLKDQGIIA